MRVACAKASLSRFSGEGRQIFAPSAVRGSAASVGPHLSLNALILEASACAYLRQAEGEGEGEGEGYGYGYGYGYG